MAASATTGAGHLNVGTGAPTALPTSIVYRTGDITKNFPVQVNPADGVTQTFDTSAPIKNGIVVAGVPNPFKGATLDWNDPLHGFVAPQARS